MGNSICPTAVSGSGRWWPSEVPTDGQWNCPVISWSRSHPLPLVAWVRGSESPGLITGVGVTEQPIDGGVGDRLEHVFVEAGRIRVRGQRVQRSVLEAASTRWWRASAVSVEPAVARCHQMQIRSTHDLADCSAEALVDAVPVEMGHLLEQLTPTLKSEAPIEGTSRSEALPA